MAYLLDANVFIQGKKLHYGLDFCPAFWEWLILQNQHGGVYSIEKVADEILAGEDDLSDWVADRGDQFFLQPDDAMLPALSAVSNWVSDGRYKQSAVNEFLQVADYYLVSYALAHEYVVVTHEISKPDRVRKVQIPDVCIGLKVKCMTPFEMLRKERARFVLGPTE